MGTPRTEVARVGLAGKGFDESGLEVWSTKAP